MRPDELALRYVGIRERPGDAQEPFIQFINRLAGGPEDERDAWCGSFAYFIAGFNLGLGTPQLPRRARSWLTVGSDVRKPGEAEDVGALTRLRAAPGDVVILSRGPLPQPGPNVLNAPGHVGFLLPELPEHLGGIAHGADELVVVSGNQSDAVTVAAFPLSRVLGVRRLRPARG